MTFEEQWPQIVFIDPLEGSGISFADNANFIWYIFISLNLIQIMYSTVNGNIPICPINLDASN